MCYAAGVYYTSQWPTMRQTAAALEFQVELFLCNLLDTGCCRIHQLRRFPAPYVSGLTDFIHRNGLP